MLLKYIMNHNWKIMEHYYVDVYNSNTRNPNDDAQIMKTYIEKQIKVPFLANALIVHKIFAGESRITCLHSLVCPSLVKTDSPIAVYFPTKNSSEIINKTFVLDGSEINGMYRFDCQSQGSAQLMDYECHLLLEFVRYQD